MTANKQVRPGMVLGIRPDSKDRVEGGCRDQIEVDHAAAGRSHNIGQLLRRNRWLLA